MAAVVVYVGTTIFGGYIYPGYSHVSQAISELIGSGSPVAGIINPLFLFYNILLLLFSYAVYMKWGSVMTKIGAVLLGVVAGASILMWWFPMDVPGGAVTQTGVIHIILASIESLSTVITAFLFGVSLKKRSPYLSAVSFVTGIALLLTGPLAGISVSQESPYMGIFERITIGAFMIWLWLTSFELTKTTLRA
jgi:hypothetical protein